MSLHPDEHTDLTDPAAATTRRRFLGLLGAGVGAAAAWHAGATLHPGGVASAAGPAPIVIPALREWTGGTGSYQFGTTTRVVAGPALADAASALAADLSSIVGRTVAVVTGGAGAGDIVLQLGATDTALGDEGYRMIVGSTLTVRARTATGAFWGTRTIVQILKQTRTVGAGTARDWPTHRERALMIDTARKFYPIAWIEARIRELSYLKYNVLHLHLTDDQAFRIESDTVPDAVSPEHYTKAEIADLIAYAAWYRVTLVPEIDMPGHMTAVLANRPELALRRESGNLSLDLSKAEAWQLGFDLLGEYLPLFPSPIWHLGADEWLSTRELDQFPQLAVAAQASYGPNATGRDLQYGFVNEANDIVRAAGKTMRIWNDQLVPGTVVTVNPNITIDHWFGADEPTPQQFADLGHDLVNTNWNRLYYIVGLRRLDPAVIYESFAANQFAYRDGSTPLAAGSPRLRGTQLAIWGEPGRDEPQDQIAANVAPSLRSLAQVTWGTPKPAATYVQFADLVAAVGDAPDP